MSTGRRIIIGERGSQKQAGRASYYQDSDKKSDVDFPQYSRSPSNNLLRPNYYDDRMKYSQMPRTPSESNLRPREQYFKTNLARRKNDGVVNNLKSQLQNLKMEVSRLMNKEGDQRMTHSGIQPGYRSSISKDGSEHSREDRLTLDKYGKDVSDIISVTSQNLIQGPLKRLQNQYQTQGYDHAHYLQLQNNLLKTQLRNLKNKYNATKQQLKQKCQALQKKNQYLQISLRRTENQLYQYKKNLETEMQTIKFQLSRRYQQEIEQQQKRYERVQPQRDYPSDNEHIQKKMKNLYEELSNKTRQLNNLNLELNEAKGEIQKHKFEIKKQQEKNNEIMKQLEIAKRQKSRNQTFIEDQQSRKNQMQKAIDTLRLKVDQLAHQLKLKDDVVSNAQQVQHKLTCQLNFYKDQQHRISEQNCELAVQIRKLRQLNQSNQQQISYLKNNITEFTNQIEQLSRNLRLEKEKVIETEEYYRKKIDDIKMENQELLERLKNQNQGLKERLDEVMVSGVGNGNGGEMQVNQDRLRQLKKWRTEYKLLLIKFNQLQESQTSKKQQIQTYYKSYKQYKSKNKILQKRTQILQQSANQYIQKIQQIQSMNLQQRQNNFQRIRNLQAQINFHERQNHNLNEQLNQLQQENQFKIQCLTRQQNYRIQLEQKVMNMDLEDNQGLNQILEVIKKRLEEQDQKINKYIKDNKNKENIITKLRKEVKELFDKQEEDFQNFRRKEIQEKIRELQSTSFQAIKQLQELARKDLQLQIQSKEQIIAECAQLKSKQSQMDTQLATLKQQINNITDLYNKKSLQMNNSITHYQQKIIQLENVLSNNNMQADNFIRDLQKELEAKQQEIMSLRSEIMNFCNLKLDTQGRTFDQALKNQIESGKKVREELAKKNQEVYRLRDSLSNLKAEYDSMKSASDIAKLRFISDKKNIQVGCQVQIQQLKNNLAVQQKKIQSLQQKIKMVIDQNKKKDTFIQAYIMGKKLPTTQRDFINVFLKEYEITVTGKNISERLQNQSQQLQKLSKYNLSLMKDLAQLRNKLQIYQSNFEEFQGDLVVMQQQNV